MKINIQKIAIMGASFLAVLSIILTGAIPGHAAMQHYNPSDYVSSISVSGDTKTVTFDFSSIASRFILWEYFSDGTSEKSTMNGALSMYNLSSNLSRVYSMTFPLGYETYKENLDGGRGLDVSDICSGAELTFTCSWDVNASVVTNGNASGTTEDQGCVLIVRSYVMLFDANKNYMRSVQGVSKNIEIANKNSGSIAVDSESQVVIPSNCAYIVPFYEVQITNFYLSTGQWRISISNTGFSFSTDINMIYENSQTMIDIKDAIGDLNSSIQDTNDKLDDVNQNLQDNNEKLDEIISGGDAAVDAEDDYNKLEQGSQAIQDAMDNQNKAEEKLPKPPTSVKDIVSDDTDKAVDDALDTAGQLFDWEASGLNNMYVPMGLSVSLSTLFYIIFGKKG